MSSGRATCLPPASVPAPSRPSRSCERPVRGPAYDGAAAAPCVLKGVGSLAREGEQRAGEWPLLVLAARGLCPPDARSNCPEPGPGRGGVVVVAVHGLIENRDEFIKFSFVWG